MEIFISLKEEKRDWEGLARKISRGLLPEDAATEAGIPWEEAKTWLEARRATKSYDDDSLRLLSAKALAEGLEALMREAQNSEGRVKGEGGEFGRTFEFGDIDAAKALVAAGLKLRSMLASEPGTKKTAGQVIDDLFDRASNWSFPTAE